MAAAVFLHNAIFTNEPPAPPASIAPRVSIGSTSTGHGRSSNHRRGPHMRQLSSVSSVTLQTSTSEHSHPTEPLIHPGSSESSVYLDLLARQPTHPSSPPPTRGTGLTLQGDPVTQRERRNIWERAVRRRLQRLRWAGRALTVIICGWAVYNTVRYFVGAMLHPYRDRQIVAIVLGSCAALSVACVLVSIIIDASAPQLGWYYKPRSTHVLLLDFLNYSSSFCVLAPAIVNFVLVLVWRDSADPLNSLRGRCHWDIDVVWSGLGGHPPDPHRFDHRTCSAHLPVRKSSHRAARRLADRPPCRVLQVLGHTTAVAPQTHVDLPPLHRLVPDGVHAHGHVRVVP
ncbi:hypothetical protein NUW54_g13963 [Trametes sanguinea]|uniref:Uncharacterized protein n=1 Tax=Trametes sanguinea TaxID=158606 RepID=A0ACC1MGD2_9APHY|nr:hypothetical protein NUW54_g13963 [Trametes sanguinea]